jgi:hypothetical protein
MFRPISGHPKVHNLCLKHTEEGIEILLIAFYGFVFLLQYVLNTNFEPEDDLK